MQSQSIIIIHPGSQNLRIGRASDLSPHLILHAVARRRLWNGIPYEDHLLPPSVQPVSFMSKLIHYCNDFLSCFYINVLLNKLDA